MSRVVVITGASSGVGRATARAFAQRGCSVALLARGRDGLEGAAADVRERGGRALALPTDVADAEAVEAAAAASERELGPIDVWVNAAMAGVLAPFAETSAEDFRRTTEVTYLGYVHGTMAALRRMRLRDSGSIVQVGSAISYRSIPLQSAYCGAKFAIRGFTDSVRVELKAEKSKVRLSTVHLPAMNTPQFGRVKTVLRHHPRPVPPIYQPEVAADAIVWASEHRRRELWVTPATYGVILGGMFGPLVAECYLAWRGIEDQQTDLPIASDRPDLLHDPLPGDPGVHGIFDEKALSRSVTWLLSRHRREAGLGLAVLGSLAGYLRNSRRLAG